MVMKWREAVLPSRKQFFIMLTVYRPAYSVTSCPFHYCLRPPGLSALSSLALMFADPKETGALLGAMGVATILCGQIVAPVVFNSIFA